MQNMQPSVEALIRKWETITQANANPINPSKHHASSTEIDNPDSEPAHVTNNDADDQDEAEFAVQNPNNGADDQDEVEFADQNPNDGSTDQKDILKELKNPEKVMNGLSVIADAIDKASPGYKMDSVSTALSLLALIFNANYCLTFFNSYTRNPNAKDKEALVLSAIKLLIDLIKFAVAVTNVDKKNQNKIKFVLGATKLAIGVIDIYGWENLKNNSMEITKNLLGAIVSLPGDIYEQLKVACPTIVSYMQNQTQSITLASPVLRP